MNHRRGNAFFVTLISVVLLGALTFVVGRQMSGGTAQSISDEKLTLYANELITYATIMENTIEQMGQFGVSYNEINFALPGSMEYNDGIDDITKLFHPSGGGMNWPATIDEQAQNQNATINKGEYHFQYGTNVEWTPTTATDIMLTVFGISDALCVKINKIISNDNSLFAFTGTVTSTFENGGTDTDFTASQCASCESKIIGCVNASANENIFYAVVGRR